MKRLDGKTAMITSAARGTGRVLAEACAAEGARGTLAGIDVAQARQSEKEIGPAAIAMEIDIARQDMIERGKRGRISNVASRTDRRGKSLSTVCYASIAAVISRTQSAVPKNRIQHCINVNAVARSVADGKRRNGVESVFAKHGTKPLRQGMKSAHACLAGAWVWPKSAQAWRSSSPPARPTTSSPRPAASMADSG